MAERERIEELERALQAGLAGGDWEVSGVEPGALPLVRVARDLVGLPRKAFRTRLKKELLARPAKPRAKREVAQTVTPYLTVEPAAELVEFVKRAFGAKELLRTTGSVGGLHAEVRIGDSRLMIGGGSMVRGNATRTALHLYVPDADSVYERALAAGARSTSEPVDRPYGDREAGVEDLAGNEWYIATRKGPTYVPEGLHSVTPCLNARGAAGLIEFLERAFGAEEVARHESPDGVIRHATVRIGDSAIEMGEAHGRFQPLPAMFLLAVPDADAAHRRALAAGAVSVSEPADQPFGARSGAVKDPSGHLWYVSSPLRRKKRAAKS